MVLGWYIQKKKKTGGRGEGEKDWPESVLTLNASGECTNITVVDNGRSEMDGEIKKIRKLLWPKRRKSGNKDRREAQRQGSREETEGMKERKGKWEKKRSGFGKSIAFVKLSGTILFLNIHKKEKKIVADLDFWRFGTEKSRNPSAKVYR